MGQVLSPNIEETTDRKISIFVTFVDRNLHFQQGKQKNYNYRILSLMSQPISYLGFIEVVDVWYF